MTQYDALLRFFNFSQEPEKLEDEEWCKLVEQMFWAAKFMGKLKDKE